MFLITDVGIEFHWIYIYTAIVLQLSILYIILFLNCVLKK